MLNMEKVKERCADCAGEKYIIREVPAEYADLSFYFDDSYIKGDCGYCQMLFIVAWDRGRVYGINADEYKRVMEEAEELVYDYDDIKSDEAEDAETFEEYCKRFNIPGDINELAEFAEHGDYTEPENIARYLTITTGKPWNTTEACGYCQGDYCDIVYCEEYYTEHRAMCYGEVFCGAAKEFCTIELDEFGDEIDSCYGYIVADDEIKDWSNSDEEYKQLVCEWACINADEAVIEMVDGCHTSTTYSYRRSA